MIRPSTTAPDAAPDRPAVFRALVLGLLAGVAIALVYGVLSEPFELTLGLIVVGIVGGWVIGAAVTAGGWAGRPHPVVRSMQVTAAAVAVVAWVVGLGIAYVVSQVLIPQASTALAERISVSGFLGYFVGLDLVRFIHVIALALMAFVAWRGAR